MTHDEMQKVVNGCKTKSGRVRSLSFSFKNTSAETDDSIYIAPSYDMSEGASGHPISGEGIGAKSFEVKAFPEGNLRNFVETIKHNKLKLKMIRFKADDDNTLSAINIEYTTNISVFSPKGTQESFQLSTFLDPKSEHRDTVDIENPPFDLCPTTKALANVPFGKTLHVTYFIED